MSEPLKVGIVGTGGIAKTHMTAYLNHPDRVRLMAVCDIVEPLAQEYAKEGGVEAVYTDIEEMLRDADIDAVDICTGHNLHAPQAVAAAQAGKHVLVEKAMSNTLEGCREMIEAADKAGVTLMVAHHLRHSLEAAAVKRFIDAGNLGEIQAVRTHQIMRAAPKSWMCDGEAGGGVLLVNSIHHIDLLRYYVGNVKRVMGFCKSVQPQMINGAEDLVSATLEFENDVIGDVFGSWTTNLVPESASYMLFGSNGTLHSTPPDNPRAKESPIPHFGTVMLSAKEDEELDPRNQLDLQKLMHPSFDPLATNEADQPTRNFFVNEILHFEECCRTGEEPISSGRDNLETMKVIMAIFESSETGQAVNLEDL